MQRAVSITALRPLCSLDSGDGGCEVPRGIKSDGLIVLSQLHRVGMTKRLGVTNREALIIAKSLGVEGEGG